MAEVFEVSSECYQAIEIWLEDFYETLPFKRIYEGGEILGYRGFMRNYDLTFEEVIPGVIVGKVTTTQTHKVMLQQFFDTISGLPGSSELQGHLI